MRITDTSLLSDAAKKRLADSIAKQNSKKAMTTPQDDFKRRAGVKVDKNTREGFRSGLKTFTFPIDLKNDNNGRSHHYGKSAKRRKDYEKIIRTIAGQQIPPDCKQKLIITRILGKRQQKFDPDSILRGSSKEFVDSLKACGFFHDDSCKWLTEVIGRQDDTQRDLGPAVKIEIFTTS